MDTRNRTARGGIVAIVLAALTASGSAHAWDLLRPLGCATGISLTYPVEFALNTTAFYDAPSLFAPASTTPMVHNIHLLEDVLAAKQSVDEVGDSNAFVPYDELTWPARHPANRHDIVDEDYPLSGDGRSEIGFIPILDPLFVAAMPVIIYDPTSCLVVEADVWLNTFVYSWAFGTPGDHGESAFDAGLCVGGAIRPGAGCGLFSPGEPMFVRPVITNLLLAVLGFDGNIGQHSFRNNGTYPWQRAEPALFAQPPELVLLPDDRAGLRAHYPAATPAGEIDVGVVNTHPDTDDGGRNKLLCRPGGGTWLPSTSPFDEFCSRTPPPATACGGDVVHARFSIVNNGTQDVTVTPAVRFATGGAGWPGEPRIAGGPETIPAGATHLVEIRQYLPPGLAGGATYGLWGEADTGTTFPQETRANNNLTPLRGSVTMGPGCDT